MNKIGDIYYLNEKFEIRKKDSIKYFHVGKYMIKRVPTKYNSLIILYYLGNSNNAIPIEREITENLLQKHFIKEIKEKLNILLR